MTKMINTLSSTLWQTLAFISVFGYVITAFSVPAIHQFFSTLVVIGSLFTLKLYFKVLIKEPIFIILLLVVILQVISWSMGLSVLGEAAASQPKIDKLARLFLFIPLAFWLSGQTKKICWLWGGYFLAIFLACLQSPTFSDDLINLSNGIRVDFGIKNAMYTSVISGLCCLVATVLFFFEVAKTQRRTGHLILNLSIVVISAIILTGSQSRQVFVAFAVLLLLLPIFTLICFSRAKQFKTKILLSYLVIPVIIFALFQQSAIKKRFSNEQQTTSAIINGDFERIPLNSSGIRIHSWVEASKSIVQYPLFGLGSAAPKFVIKSSELFQTNLDNLTIKGLQHFHNYHIDMLASYGFIGWLLMLCPYIFILFQLYKFRHTTKNGESWLFLGLNIIIFWLVVNSFESYNLRSYGVITHNIFMASFLSLYIFNKKLMIRENTLTKEEAPHG